MTRPPGQPGGPRLRRRPRQTPGWTGYDAAAVARRSRRRKAMLATPGAGQYAGPAEGRNAVQRHHDRPDPPALGAAGGDLIPPGIADFSHQQHRRSQRAGIYTIAGCSEFEVCFITQGPQATPVSDPCRLWRRPEDERHAIPEPGVPGHGKARQIIGFCPERVLPQWTPRPGPGHR